MSDRVVVITGASGGLGASLAELLAKKGDRVVLAARRERELSDVATRCGKNALAVVADVTKRGDSVTTLARAIERFGHVDAWVNNAGQGMARAASEITDEDFDEMMLVNTKTALYGMQTVLPHFKERKRGHILNVSSTLGRLPLVWFPAMYSASKHALNALTAMFRMELRESFPEIHVSLVSPGQMATPFGANAKHVAMLPPYILERIRRATPAAQSPAQSADEAAAVIADVLDRPRADAYTRPGMREEVAAYYAAEDMDAVEKAPPFVSAPPKP
jgi:NAD(P)-dependent dehydrogenase (short-subunit alcohol dehydrogenase family)